MARRRPPALLIVALWAAAALGQVGPPLANGDLRRVPRTEGVTQHDWALAETAAGRIALVASIDPVWLDSGDAPDTESGAGTIGWLELPDTARGLRVRWERPTDTPYLLWITRPARLDDPDAGRAATLLAAAQRSLEPAPALGALWAASALPHIGPYLVADDLAAVRHLAAADVLFTRARQSDTLRAVRAFVDRFPADRRCLYHGQRANLLIDLGAYADAAEALSQAGRAAQQGGHLRQLADVQLARANLDHLRGRHASARRILESLLAELPEEHVVRGQAWLSLGVVLENQGLAPTAIEAFGLALQAGRGSDDPNLAGRARSNLCRLLRHAGRLDQAASEAEELLLGDHAPDIRVSAQLTLGYVALTRGTLDEAAERVAAARELILRSPRPDLELSNRDLSARVALASGDLERAEADLAAAESLLESLSRATRDAMGAAGVRSRYAEWSALRQDLVRARWQAADPDDRSELLARGLVDVGRFQARALLESVAGHGEAWPGAVDVPQLQAALGADRLLVDFVAGTERLQAYSLDEQGLRLHVLGRLDALSPRVERYMEALSGAVPVPPEELLAAGQELYARLLEPVLAGRSPAELVVVPASGAPTLPLESLAVRRRSGCTQAGEWSDLRFVLHDMAVRHLPGSALLTVLDARAPRPGPGRALVAVDPLLPAESLPLVPEDAPRHSRLARLENTFTEGRQLVVSLIDGEALPAEDLAGLLLMEGRRSDSWEAAGVRLVRGRGLDHQLFAGDLRDLGLLQVSTHAVRDRHDPAATGLVLSHALGEPGLLTVEQVRELELDGTLVVLAACDTATGPSLAGEGVQSLAHAFLQAGASEVLGTLWPVDDEHATRFMSRFHARRLSGVGVLEALRATQLEEFEPRRRRGEPLGDTPATEAAPRYWAAWVLSGWPARR